MPTSVFINERLALRLHRHTGVVTRSEISNLIELYRVNPRVFMYDTIQILEDTAVFGFGVEQLPAFKVDFQDLVEGAKLPLILRSAWVCPSAQAWSVCEAWLHERHSLDGLHTEPCLVGSLAEAAGLFEDDELDAVRSMAGFQHYFST
ncbi:MAG: hypothetical protein QM759_13250 [Terricaulis sp.]